MKKFIKKNWFKIIIIISILITPIKLGAYGGSVSYAINDNLKECRPVMLIRFNMKIPSGYEKMTKDWRYVGELRDFLPQEFRDNDGFRRYCESTGYKYSDNFLYEIEKFPFIILFGIVFIAIIIFLYVIIKILKKKKDKQ